MEKITKPVFIMMMVGALLLGIGTVSALMGPNVRKIRKERKELFEQLDKELEANAEIREQNKKEREGWFHIIDSLEQNLILIDERISDKETALDELEKENNETLDSLTALPDSLHQQFLTDKFGIQFD